MAGIRVFALCVVLAGWSSSLAQQPTPVTVEDLVRIGLAQNKELLAVRQRVAEANGQLIQAGIRPSPTLELRGSTGRPLATIGEDQYGADINQTLELFGKRSARVAVANFEITQAQAELQQKSSELALQIRNAVAEQILERRKVELFGKLNSLNQDALRLTDARVREGETAKLDANLLRVEVNRGIVLRRSAQGRLLAAEAKLRKLTGLPDDQPIPGVTQEWQTSLTLEQLKSRAMVTRIDLKAAQAVEGESEANVRLARANGRPDVTLSVGYEKQHNQFDGIFGQTSSGAITPIRDSDDLLSFGVSIPLRTSRTTRGDVQSAQARTSAAHLRREFLERTIPIEVEAAYQQWTAARESLDLLQTGVVDLSTDNLKVMQEAYKLGQLRLLDVINEQRRLVDNETALIEGQAEAALDFAELEHAIGGDLP